MGKKHKKHKSERRYHEHEPDDGEKPHLKLVLKLGAEGKYDSDYAAHSPLNTDEYEHREKVKKKKKRKKREKHIDNDDSYLMKKKIRIKNDGEEESNFIVESTTEPQTDDILHNYSMAISPTTVDSPKPSTEPQPLQEEIEVLTGTLKLRLEKVLDHLLSQLERKDPHDIFAWPVNDIIAPGYSAVIKISMDFSTMRKKIHQHEYNSLAVFKNDFKLMTDNCCIYNRPDTIYYQAAKKLYAAGCKIMSKDRLLNLKKVLPFLHEMSNTAVYRVLGLPPNYQSSSTHSITVDSLTSSQEESSAPEEIDLRAHSDAISFTDHDNEDTVAPDVLQAAKEVKERLNKLQPKSKMGFLRIDDDGLTTLNFINPNPQDDPSKVVDLGTITGCLTDGLPALPEMKEDKRNKITPLSYLSYGPFGSFAPTYDSRLSNISKEATDLLLSTYGGETEYLFAQSLENFVQDCDDHLLKMVGDLLDTVTNGMHSKTTKNIKTLQRDSPETTKSNTTALSPQNKLATIAAVENKSDVQGQLNQAGELIKKLQQTQNIRLSQTPKPGESNLTLPTEEEHKTATSLQNTLSNLVKQTNPENLTSASSIRQLMGVDISS